MKISEEILTNWAKQSFNDQLDELESLAIFNDETISLTRNCLNSLGLLTKKVDGFACEGLPKNEESKERVKINYSDVFHASLSLESFTPTLYLTKLVEKFSNDELDMQRLNGFVARGIRTLASLIREPLFRDKLIKELQTSDSHVTGTLGSRQDAKDHTDILLKYQSNEYRIWLYQFTSRGLPHDIERVAGKRGALPRGTHILCPLETILAKPFLKYEKQLRTINIRLSDWRAKSELKKGKANASRKVLKYQSLVNKIEIDLNLAKTEMEREICIVQGWYLYSDQYISRFVKILQAGVIPDNYNIVQDIMKGPEEYLKDIRFFKV